MKTNGSKSKVLGSQSGGIYSATIGSSKPPFNKSAALSKNMNKPFIKRVVEWFTA